MGAAIIICLCFGVIAVCIAQILKEQIDYREHLEGAKECYRNIFPWIEGDKKVIIHYEDEHGNIQTKEVNEELEEFRMVFKVYDIWLIKENHFITKVEAAKKLQEILKMAKAYIENDATSFVLLHRRKQDIEYLDTLEHNVFMYLYQNT